MSELSKQALKVDNNQSFPNNTAGLITPNDLRTFNENMIDSLVDEIGYNVDSASFDNRINNITGSATDTGSLLTTASFNNGTRDLTFTKGDSSTFAVNIPDVSGSILPAGLVSGSSQINYPQISNIPAGIVSGSSQLTGSGFATTGSNTFVGNQIITGSVEVSETVKSQVYINPQIIDGFTIPTNNNAMLVGPVGISGSIVVEGNSKLIVLDQVTGSALPSGVVSGSSQLTASYDLRYELSGSGGGTIDTSSLATTGSNIFIGNQTITGSLFVSQSEQGSRGGVVFQVSQEGGPGSNNGVVVDGRFSVNGPANFQAISMGNLFTDNLYSDSGGPTPIRVRSNLVLGEDGPIPIDLKVSGSLFVSSSDVVTFIVPSFGGAPAPGGLSVTGSMSVNGNFAIVGGNFVVGQVNTPKIVGEGGTLDIVSNVKIFNDGDINNSRTLGVSGSAFVSQSISVGEAVRLSPSDPLPTGSIGALAVSGSSLFFYNGAWTLVV